MAELGKEETRARKQAKTTAQNLKRQLTLTEEKLEKLLDVYLNETITTEEYASRKEKLIKLKVGLINICFVSSISSCHDSSSRFPGI